MFCLNKKDKQTKNASLVAKVVLVILLLCMLSNRNYLNSIYNNITKLQNLNFDFMINDMMLLGRLTIVNYSTLVALGLAVLSFGMIITLTCCLCSSKTEAEESSEVKVSTTHVDTPSRILSNDIYLIQQQFLC